MDSVIGGLITYYCKYNNQPKKRHKIVNSQYLTNLIQNYDIGVTIGV